LFGPTVESATAALYVISGAERNEPFDPADPFGNVLFSPLFRLSSKPRANS
jgi:hypothetical protein